MQEEARLIGFGRTDTPDKLNASGVAFGSPAYTAPEVLTLVGDNHNVSETQCHCKRVPTNLQCILFRAEASDAYSLKARYSSQ